MVRHIRDSEDAARAYDEAAMLMCSPRARTNFTCNFEESMSSSRKLLSSTLRAKLRKCHVTSLQMDKRTESKKEDQESQQQSPCFDRGESMENREREGGDMVNWEAEMGNFQHDKSSEDEHIEQMIEELLDYGSVELPSILQN